MANKVLLYDNFRFVNLEFSNYSYTDKRKGSCLNYIGLMKKGTAKLVGENKTVKVAEGDLFTIPHNCKYQSYWYGNPEINFLSIGFLNTEATETVNFDLQVVNCNQSTKDLLLQIPTSNNQVSCKALGIFYTVLDQILPFINQKNECKREVLVKNAKKFIKANPDCSVSDIAKHLYISEPYLYSAFKLKANCSPNEYKLKIKCQNGIEKLLATDKTVEQISAEVGFSSATHFRKTLKKFVGLTPKEIRKSDDFRY